MYAISLMFAMQTVCSKFRQSILWPHSMAFCLPPEINKKNNYTKTYPASYFQRKQI